MLGNLKSRVRICAAFLGIVLVVAACQPTGYVYDEQGRLRGVVTAEETVRYRYDAAGNIVGIDRYPSDQVSVIEFSPDRGRAGTEVTIQGTAFSETLSENTVAFNGRPATVTAAKVAELTVIAPSGVTTGAITATTPNGSAISSEPFTVQPDRTPSITGVSPTVVAPGASVTVTGTNFATDSLSNVAVIGGTSYMTVGSATATQLTVTAPPVGTSGNVSVATADGTAVSTADLWVVPPPYTPAQVGFTGRAQVGGPAVTVSLGTAGRVGLVAFDGTAGQQVSSVLSGDTFAGSYPRVKVFGPAGLEVGNLDYIGGTAVLDPMTLPLTGTYTMVVDPLPSSTGAINVQLHDAPTVGGEMTIGGAPVTVDLTAPGQNGALTFGGTAGQAVSVVLVDDTLAGVPGNLGWVSVLGPDDSELAELPVYSSTAPDVVGRLTLPTDGTYRVVVDPRSVATGSATLQVHNAADIERTITVGGAAVTVDITAPGQNAVLSFNGTAGQIVSATLSAYDDAVPCCAWGDVRILAPDNTQLATTPVTNNSSDPYLVGRVTLPTNGTYRLVVDLDGAVTSSATLRLYNAADIPRTLSIGGAASTVNIGAPGQNAVFSFNGTAGQTVSATLAAYDDPVPCCAWGDVRILAPDNTQLATTPVSSSSSDPYLVGRVTLPTNGTYQLVVDLNGSVTSAATLRLYDAADLQGTIVAGGPAVTSTISTPGQNAIYRFDGTAGTAWTLSLTADTFSACSPEVRVLKPDGTELVRTPCVSSTPNSLPLGTLPTTGSYSIVVDPFAVTTGAITLRLVAGSAAAEASHDTEVQPEVPASDAEPPSPEPTEPPAGEVGASPDESQAVAAGTAVSGQVRGLNNVGIQGATLSVAGHQTTTGADGSFTLTLPDGLSGHRELVVDGRSANQGATTYGTFEVGVDLTEGATTTLGYTVWLPILDTAHAVTLTYPLTAEVVVTNPSIPGLEVRIAAGSEIRDINGQLVTQVGITPIPLDKPPFPLPAGATALSYFTFQPGGGSVSSGGIRVVYPNTGARPAGAWLPLFDYSPTTGWSVYDVGNVSSSASQILPSTGTSITNLSGVGGVFNSPGFVAPPEGLTAGGGPSPVDLATGLFTTQATDLVVSDILPLSVTRSYRHDDTARRAFGLGWSSGFDLYLHTPLPFDHVDLILPDGVRLRYNRVDGGTTVVGSVFEHTSTPSSFFGSRVRWTLSGWELTLKDGSRLLFGDTGYLLAMTDPTGKQITLRRTGRSVTGVEEGNIAAVYGPFGRWLAYTYDTQGRVTTARDHAGRTVTYTYDTSGRLTTVTDPAGGVVRYGYNAQNRLTTITNPANTVVLTNQYGAPGARVSRQVFADGTDVELAYQISGTQVTRTDVTGPDGTVRRVTFDQGYWMTDSAAVGTALAQTTSVERQAGTHAVTAQIDHTGRRVEYTHDALGNLTSVTALGDTADAVTTTYTYDPRWNKVATQTDPLNRTRSYTYDDQGNLATVEDAAGSEATFTYDQWGRQLSATDPLGRTSTVAYELLHRVTTTNPLGHRSTQFMDAAGRLGSATDALGNRAYFRYDALDRLTSMVDPHATQIGVVYDAVGNVDSLTDQAGHTTQWDYDLLGRVTSRTDPLGTSETYEYDVAGRPTERTDRRGLVTGYDYDALGRMTRMEFGVTATAVESSIDYSYDTEGRTSEVDDSAYGAVTFAYDDLDRLTSETTPQGTVTYQYDDAGQRTSRTVQGGATTTYAYDDLGAVSSITQGSLAVSITRDASGQATSATLPNGVTATYEYDAAGQTTKIVYDSNATPDPLGDLAYTYDAVGRRRTASGGLANTILPEAVASSAHNNANRVTSWGGATLTYDNAGNLTSDGTSTYTWNARGELTGVDGPVDATFTYDPFGRRTRKVAGSQTTNYLYDGANIVREQRAGSTATYLGGGVDELFARQVGSQTTTYLTDGLGSTVALVDQTGAIATEYSYGPFGTTSAEGSSDPNPFRFTGRELDETGLYQYRARYYSPEISRFISEDPLGISSGDPNAYAYVANSPTNSTDPSGMCASLPQAMGLFADEIVLFGTWMSQNRELTSLFRAGSITADEYSAGFGTAASAALTGLAAAIAVNCGPLFGDFLGLGPSPRASQGGRPLAALGPAGNPGALGVADPELEGRWGAATT